MLCVIDISTLNKTYLIDLIWYYDQIIIFYVLFVYLYLLDPHGCIMQIKNRIVIFVLCSVHGILSVIIFGCTSWNSDLISIIWCWMFVCTFRWMSLHRLQMNLLHSTHFHFILMSDSQSSQSFGFCAFRMELENAIIIHS